MKLCLCADKTKNNNKVYLGTVKQKSILAIAEDH